VNALVRPVGRTEPQNHNGGRLEGVKSLKVKAGPPMNLMNGVHGGWKTLGGVIEGSVTVPGVQREREGGKHAKGARKEKSTPTD